MSLKIVTLTYYHPMARFISAIEDEWKKKEPSVEFLHLTVFPSAFVYLFLRGKNVKSPTWKSLLSNKFKKIDDDIVNSLIRFHTADPKISARSIEKLKAHARLTLAEMEASVNDFKPDMAIVSGDTRLPAEALIRCLKEVKSRIFYFEQGPYRTTILDTKGVNANCSFRGNLREIPIDGIAQHDFKFPTGERYSNKVYTLIDKLMLLQGRFSGLVPPDVVGYNLSPINNALYSKIVRPIPASWTPKKTVLLALQVPEDANNIYHNPLGLDDYELVDFVIRALPPDWNFLVREHPLFKRKYSKRFYELIQSNERACLSCTDLNGDLSSSNYTVTINSMTGLDAYIKGHKVAVLGDSFYDHLPGIFIVRTPDELREFVQSDLTKINRDYVIGEMAYRYLIPGHFKDKDLSFVKNAVGVLMKSMRLHNE